MPLKIRAMQLRLNAQIMLKTLGMVLLGFAVLQYWLTLGPVSRHMLGHIISMTLVAPLVAWLLLGYRKKSLQSFAAPRVLWSFAVLQLVFFLAWHAPPGMAWAMQGPVQAMVLHGSLFGAALGFWLSVGASRKSHRWHAIFALLATGKLFCLVALLLVFSPRFLYALHAHHVPTALADQQLAGAIMVVVCPLTYVLSAVVLLSRWFLALVRAEREAWPHDP